MAAVLAIVAGCVAAVRFGGGALLAPYWEPAIGVAIASALVFGTPILAFTLRRGLTVPAVLLPLGALAGALPLLVLGVSGVINLHFRFGGWDRVSWALDLGMPIPGAGIVFWPRFLRLELQAILLGLAAAQMYWLVMIRSQPESRAFHVLLALFVLGTLVTVAAFLR